MRQALFFILLLFCVLPSFAQLAKKPVFSGMYLQWGYNRDKFSKSTIHFWDEGKYDFTLHNVTASDKPDFEGFRTNPIDITIPQNSLRIGVYLNKERTHAIELNFDHAKYVMDHDQRVRMTGNLGGEHMDRDTMLVPWFVSFEHTNGANFTMINYVGQKEILHSSKRRLATCIWKIGAGVVIPRSDVRFNYRRVDNRYHIAGYMAATEAGLRFYVLKNLFLEATAKAGYANFRNVLTVGDGRASHSFYFGEVIGLLGYDINNAHWFRRKGRSTSK
jgi:hypothetical protein